MTYSLENLHILVTRPEPEGFVLQEILRAEGAEVLYLPTILFGPPPDIAAFDHQIREIGEQDWLIFVSPRAVFASVVAIRRQWPELPPKLQFAAVGASTAGALKEAGYLAIYPGDQWSSEGILALPEFQTIKDKKIALIKGEGGREYLEQTLLLRGAKILPVISYQRQIPKVDVSVYQQALEKNRLDVIIGTSFEGVQNLKKLIGEKHWSLLKNTPLIVTSERIKMLAYKLGFQTIWVAQNATHATIVALLQQKRDELCQLKKMKS